MATYSTGMSATWNGVAFTEVFAISLNTGGARQGRSSVWPQGEAGSLTISAYGTANMTTASVGERKAVAVTGGGISFSGFGIMESVTADPELNGVTRFTASITLCY